MKFSSCGTGSVPVDVLETFGKADASSSKSLAHASYACATFEQEATIADLKGSVKDSFGNPMGNIAIYLPSCELYAVEPAEKITTDENGDFVLRNVPYKVYIADYFGEEGTSYYYSKKMQVVLYDKSLGAFDDMELEKADTVRINGFIYLDVGTIVVEPLYSLKVSLEKLAMDKGDEYCLEWIRPCHKVTSGFMGASEQVVTVGP